MSVEIIRLGDQPGRIGQAARWFHEKWGIPEEAYLESMEQSLTGENPVPQWYLALEEGTIVGGLGVIENDFHDRVDLSPNVCAVYTEPEKRGRGIAGAMLYHVCRDMNRQGIPVLYLLTDHVGFYERYGWEFLCMVQGDGEPDLTRMYSYDL